MVCPDDGAADACDEVRPTPPPHVAQQSCWDCGVACAEMALLARGLPVGRADLVKQLVTSSVWSIDLAYALTRCGVECVYYTTALGVKSSHAMHGFYQDTFSDDEVRVNSLFARAASSGVRVHERAVSEAELADLIAAGALAIVLVNAPDLAVATPVAAGRLTSLLHSAAACVSRVMRTSDYFGHFILVFGYDAKTDCFLFRNPDAFTNGIFAMSSAQLDCARGHDGTDMDVILFPPPAPV